MQQAVCLTNNKCIVTVKSNTFIVPTDFPLGSHEKFSKFIPGIVLWVGVKSFLELQHVFWWHPFALRTSLLHECLLLVLSNLVCRQEDRVSTLENCAEQQTASTIFTVLGRFWISGFLRTQNLLAVIPNTFYTILYALCITGNWIYS